MILGEWGVWRYPALGVIIATCLVAIVLGRRIPGRDEAPERRVWFVPVVAQGAGGRS
jgi:hypothetical protein